MLYVYYERIANIVFILFECVECVFIFILGVNIIFWATMIENHLFRTMFLSFPFSFVPEEKREREKNRQKKSYIL